MEVEFDAPVGTRMVIELEGGVRPLVADNSAVKMAAEFIGFLHARSHRRNGGRR